MMFARCPACQTVFRVRPEQLRAHHGRVRCGHCYAPFDALEHLQDDGRGAAARTDDAVDTAPIRSAVLREAAPPANPAPSPAAETAARPDDDPLAFGLLDSTKPEKVTGSPTPGRPPSSFDLLSDRLEFEIPDGLLAPRKAPAEPTATPARDEAPDLTEFDKAASDDTFPAFVDMSDLSPQPADETDHPPEADDKRPAYPDAPPADWPTPAQLDARFNAGADANAFAAADPFENSYDDPRLEPRFSSHAPTFDDEPHHVAELPDTASPTPTADIDTDRQPEPDFDSPRLPDSGVPTDVDFSATQKAGEAEPFARKDAGEEPDERERLDATYGPAPGARKTHWLWGLGAGVLLGTLAAQSAYLFREDLARHWPTLRPALVVACERLGCDVPLSRVAGAISIETSDLQVLPRNPGRFVLNATVRNRATYPQAFPHLELTLTDVQDRPAVRRVLAPQEWVPASALERELFVANAEIALKLPFEARSIDAVGYRLYAFYP